MHVLKEWFGGRVRIVLLLMILFAVGVCGASIGVDLWQEWQQLRDGLCILLFYRGCE